jgi:hypothetical protein
VDIKTNTFIGNIPSSLIAMTVHSIDHSTLSIKSDDGNYLATPSGGGSLSSQGTRQYAIRQLFFCEP